MPTKEASGGDGPIFSMSNVVMLSKAQLKENDTKTGIIVTSTPKKARFTRPYPVKFHISFMNGMNPYVGLQDFVSWEKCGIQRGKLEVDKKTGEMVFTAVESSPRWAIRHLGKTIASTQLFTSEVFTEEVLKTIETELTKYVQTENISYLGQPLPQDDNDPGTFNYNDGKEYSFSFEIGLKPEFTLPDFATLPTKRYVVEAKQL
jgi:hypothetical protein